MPGYVDGFVIPIPKKQVKAYLAMAKGFPPAKVVHVNHERDATASPRTTSRPLGIDPGGRDRFRAMGPGGGRVG